MLSFVIPTYKGASILQKQLPSFIKYLNEKDILHEIIVVDDGSDDDGQTQEVAEQLGCCFLANKNNQGKGASVRKGVLAAKGEYICFTDVDIPFEFEDYRSFYNCLKDNNSDIVVGDRTLPGSTYFTEISFKRKLGSDIFSAIVSKLFTAGLYDTQCGMKAFKKDVAQDLFSVSRINRFAFDVEIISIAVKRGYTVDRQPVKFRCNESKTVKVIQHGIGMLLDLFRIQFNHIVGRYKK